MAPACIFNPRFLSTPSARRATPPLRCFHQRERISIHALREEGDFGHIKALLYLIYFYPRPP